MKLSISAANRGSSPLFDTYVFWKLQRDNSWVRFGIKDESGVSFSEKEINKFLKPKVKVDWNMKKIGFRDFRSAISHFPGAYVKDPKSTIITDGGFIIDYDASLPPYEKIFIRRLEDNYIDWLPIGDYIFKEGDETLTWDDNNNSCWRKVKGKIEHDWNDDLITIKTETGKTATVTANHSIFGIKKNTKQSKPDLIHAGNLSEGDYVVGLKKFEPGFDKQSLDPYIIGLWLSDGCASSGKNGTYNIYSTYPDILKEFENLHNVRLKRKADGSKYKRDEYVGRLDGDIRKECQNFFESNKKKNFLEILKYNKIDRNYIWEGMLIGDGHYKIGKNVKKPTEELCKYRPLERDECFIVAHTIDNMNPVLTENRIKNNYKYGLDLVIKEVYGAQKGYGTKLAELNMGCSNRHPYYKLEEKIPYIKESYTESVGLDKIVELKREKYTGKVYDISVEETERFFAGTGIGAHNTSLYPSMVAQYNISFDSYYGRILSPYMNKILDFLDQFLGKGEKNIPSIVATSLMEMVVKRVEDTDSKKKNDEKQLNYFILYGLLDKLREKNIPLKNLLQPKTENEYFAMRKYLLPYLELIEEIHPLAKEYNLSVYDYLINRKDISKDEFWIIENLTQPNCSIKKISGDYIFNDLFPKGYAITLTGCVFTKHDNYMGLFYDFVNDFGNYRSQYKKLRDSFPEYSSDYVINDRKQSAVKVIMNSMYGLLGMSTYRYSNKWLAKTVTTQGRLCLKTAQYMADKYLESRKTNE